MRILIISFYFPPYHSIASIRVGKTAKYLEKFGHEVRVISAEKEPLAQTVPLEIPSEHVIYTKWRKLSPDGLQSNVQGLVANSNGLYNFTRQCWRILKSVVYFPDVFIGWIPYLKKAAEQLIQTWKPNVIFVSTAPYSSLFAVERIAAKHRIPWVADFRDLWTDNHCYPFGRMRKSIEGRIENKLLSKAVGLVTVSEPLAEKLRKRFKGPVKVICNGFDLEDYGEIRKTGSTDTKLNIIYTGTTYDDFQDPTPLFLALKKFDQKAVRLSFYGASSPRLRSLVKKLEVEPWVEFCEPVAYLTCLNIQQAADILLLLLWTDRNEKGVYTGKIFEYVGAGRPILGVGPDLDVAADLIKERKLGVILNSVEDIYEQLKKWIEEKIQFGSITALPSQSGQGFSREEQTRKLEQFMNEIVHL